MARRTPGRARRAFWTGEGGREGVEEEKFMVCEAREINTGTEKAQASRRGKGDKRRQKRRKRRNGAFYHMYI